MKIQNILMAVAAGTILVPAAFGQTVELKITGATAFRSAVRDRVENFLLNPGYTLRKLTNSSGVEVRTYVGTWSANVPALSGQNAIIRDVFTGSGEGLNDVKNQANLGFVTDDGTGYLSTPADIGFSDCAPTSANPATKVSDYQAVTRVGVVPFTWIRNKPVSGDLNTVTNITQAQAVLLNTAGGDMPASFLGSTNLDPAAIVWFVGRDAGSGTRIMMQKVVGFNGSPNYYDSLSGTFNPTNGYASGSLVKNTLTNTTDNIVTYLGIADTSGTSAYAQTLSYNGVAFSRGAVTNGSYGFWGYEICVAKAGLSADTGKQAAYSALLSSITNAAYQRTNSIFSNYVPINDMKVLRYQDGGLIYY